MISKKFILTSALCTSVLDFENNPSSSANKRDLTVFLGEFKFFSKVFLHIFLRYPEDSDHKKMISIGKKFSIFVNLSLTYKKIKIWFSFHYFMADDWKHETAYTWSQIWKIEKLNILGVHDISNIPNDRESIFNGSWNTNGIVVRDVKRILLYNVINIYKSFLMVRLIQNFHNFSVKIAQTTKFLMLQF